MNKDELNQKITILQNQMNSVEFWNDKDRAKSVLQEIKQLESERDREINVLRGSCIITILAGAGGDDSEDFAAMLFEMYRKYCADNLLYYDVLHTNVNDQGGIRNATMLISGKNAYLKLLPENGVHRLVRISPFNSNGKRHTSFAMVEVIPEAKQSGEITINPDDVDISFAKSGGPGGQNVNKRETAVRIMHKSTNIQVHVTSERSQDANKDLAMTLLKSKLHDLKRKSEQAEKEGRQISKTVDNAWGSQIRSYVLHPYKLVKNHLNEKETSDVIGVLGGDLTLVQ